MALFLAISVFVGVLFPFVASLLRPLLYPCLFVIMLATLIQMDFSSVRDSARQHLPRIIYLLIIQMLVIAAFCAFLMKTWLVSPMFALPVIMVTCAGSMFGTPAIAMVMGHPGRFALLGVLVSTLLLPLSLPLSSWIYSGSGFEMNLVSYASRLIVYIVCPVLLAVLYRRLVQKVYWLPSVGRLKPVSVVALGVFAVGIMDGITARLVAEPDLMLALLALAVFLYVALFLIAYRLCLGSGKSIAIEAGLLSAFRNIGLVIAVSGPFLPDDFFLFAGVWQFPMYLAPLITGWYIALRR
jgi:bile acid:Na+ symporter, BASS family